MDPDKQQNYLRLAMDSPSMLCSEVPTEVLVETTYDEAEPSEFFKEFLEVGYTQWALQKYGPLPLSKDQITKAIIVLWVRSCRLYISHVLGRADPEWGVPFFSDEGLYE
jgi:hypothetical protein